MLSINSRVKASVWNSVFKPKKDGRVMYHNTVDVTKVSDGHWLVLIPAGTVPAAYAGYIPGEGGRYDKDPANTITDYPDFDAIVPAVKDVSELKETSLVYLVNGQQSKYQGGCDACIFTGNDGEIYAVDRKYIELFEGLFGNVTLYGSNNCSAIRINSGGDLCGVIMPIRADHITSDLQEIFGGTDKEIE